MQTAADFVTVGAFLLRKEQIEYACVEPRWTAQDDSHQLAVYLRMHPKLVVATKGTRDECMTELHRLMTELKNE